MSCAKRIRMATALLLAGGSVGVYAAATAATTAAAGTRTAAAAAKAAPKVKQFDLNGYVVVTSYSRGRNSGNTFQQTYTHKTVQGVPIAGPFVGTKFPAEDYVAMPIGNHELYVAWLDPKTHAIVDAFVMNFSTHVVYDYAPSATPPGPASTGTVTVKHRGSAPLP